MNMNNVVIFDAGEGETERYTVFPFIKDTSMSDVERSEYLGMSEGGVAVSMWGNAAKRQYCRWWRPRIKHLNYLGKRVKFNSLSTESQQHIIRMIRS